MAYSETSNSGLSKKPLLWPKCRGFAGPRFPRSEIGRSAIGSFTVIQKVQKITKPIRQVQAKNFKKKLNEFNSQVIFCFKNQMDVMSTRQRE